MAVTIDFTGYPTALKLGDSTELVAEVSGLGSELDLSTISPWSQYYSSGGGSFSDTNNIYTVTAPFGGDCGYESTPFSLAESFVVGYDITVNGNSGHFSIRSKNPDKYAIFISFRTYNNTLNYNFGYDNDVIVPFQCSSGDKYHISIEYINGAVSVSVYQDGSLRLSLSDNVDPSLFGSVAFREYNWSGSTVVENLNVITNVPRSSWLSNGNPIGDGNPLTYTPTSVGVEDITLNVDDGTTVHTLTKPDYLTVVSGLNTSIVYNGDTIYFDLTKNIEATLSLPYIKMVDSLDNIGYRKFSDNSTISASWPINCMVDRVESEVFGAYLGAYRWENYGVRLLLDPYNYTLQDYSVDNNTRIDFDFDTGLADRETFSSERGLSFRLGSPPSPVSVQFVYDVTSTANKVVVYYGGGSPLETPYKSEWANGANVSGYIDFSGTTVNINIVVTGGGATETLTLVDGVTGYSSSESLIFYNAGNEAGTEARIYDLKIDGVQLIRAVAQLLLDEYISGQNYDATGSQPILTTLSNTFPLSPLYDTSIGQGITLELDNEGHRDFYGNITGYSLMVTPAGSLTDADFTGQTTCTAEDWEFNGVKLPFPTSGKFRPNINGSNRVTQSYGGYTDTVGTERVQGDVVDVEVECDVIKANELLKMLRDTDWSLGPVSARFAESYKPFGWRHNSLVVKVQLVDTRITSIQTGPQKVRIKFGLQYQGV